MSLTYLFKCDACKFRFPPKKKDKRPKKWLEVRDSHGRLKHFCDVCVDFAEEVVGDR